jgi:hypothetical protein
MRYRNALMSLFYLTSSWVLCAARAETPLSFSVDEWVADESKLAFAEDFKDPASLSRFVFSSPEHWKRVAVGERFALEHADATEIYRPKYRSPYNIALVATRRFGSFVLDYEVQQIGKEYGHRDACTFFGFVDPTHFYYVHVATESDPHAHQVFIVNDAPRVKITSTGTAGFDWGPTDRWHRVRLVRDIESGQILVFVNDLQQPIMRATDKTHGMGFVGVGSFDDVGRVTGIRIYAADSNSDRPSFFTAR